jgi:hypothetical protein
MMVESEQREKLGYGDRCHPERGECRGNPGPSKQTLAAVKPAIGK